MTTKLGGLKWNDHEFLNDSKLILQEQNSVLDADNCKKNYNQASIGRRNS